MCTAWPRASQNDTPRRPRKIEEDRGRSRKIEEDRGRSRKTEEDRGRSRKIEEDPGRSRKIEENIEENGGRSEKRSRKIEENRGRSRKTEEDRGRSRNLTLENLGLFFATLGFRKSYIRVLEILGSPNEFPGLLCQSFVLSPLWFCSPCPILSPEQTGC